MTAAARGRRRGSPDTRAAILAAARARFAESGFAGTSIRRVAGDAGVDPALVHHYFGSKDDLFVAALELPVDPRAVLAEQVVGPVAGAGERLLRALIGVWDDPAVRPALLAMVRRLIEPVATRCSGAASSLSCWCRWGRRWGSMRPSGGCSWSRAR